MATYQVMLEMIEFIEADSEEEAVERFKEFIENSDAQSLGCIVWKTSGDDD